ncbi:hypothetical protein ACP4OV_018485 [Aristida adscensionis]
MVEDKDLAWIDGEVFRIDGQNAHVRTKRGKSCEPSAIPLIELVKASINLMLPFN